MFSKYLLAAVVALPLGMAALSGSASAYATKYWIPVYPKNTAQPMHRTGLSCSAAGHMLRADGFRNVRAANCNGRNYTFHATRNGRAMVLRVDSRNGHMWRA